VFASTGAGLLKPEAFLPSNFVAVNGTSPLMAMMSQWPTNALLGMGPEAAALLAQQQVQQNLQQQHMQQQQQLQLQLQQQQMLQQQHLQQAWNQRALNVASLAAAVAVGGPGNVPMGKPRIPGDDMIRRAAVAVDMPALTPCMIESASLHNVFLVWAFLQVFREALDLPAWAWHEFETDLCNRKPSNYLSAPNLIGLQITKYILKHLPAVSHEGLVPVLPLNALTWPEVLRMFISRLPVAGLQRNKALDASTGDVKQCCACERKLYSDAYTQSQVRAHFSLCG
jgi:hypothetical protein